MAGEENGRRKLLVALDFGTTHTGIGYAMSHEEEILHVEEWPGINDQEEKAHKNPTLIAYTPDVQRIPWGYQVEAQSNICAWMKYHLDNTALVTKYDDPKLTEAIENGPFSNKSFRTEMKTPEDVATDYLKEVFKFTVKHLKGVLGPHIVAETPIQWWLLRPAIWSLGTDFRFEGVVKTAADGAGLFKQDRDEVHYVTDAEAAACSVLCEAAAQGDIENGDVVMVCDCGGGTVDVTVYETPQILPLEIREVIPGLGGKCGSSCIDLEFDAFMHKRFGEAYANVDPALKKERSAFTRKFQKIKHRFGDADSVRDADELEMELPLPMDGLPESLPGEYYHRRDRLVILTRQDMEDIFQPTVDKVLDLIQDQFSKAKNACGRQPQNRKNYRLLLAGGFARSKYLQSKLQGWCSEEGVILKFLENIDSWGAIAHGAVLKQLQKIELSRRLSRFHSGVRCSLLYNPDLDLDLEYPKDVYECRFTGRKYTRNCVYWYSHRGDTVNEHARKTEPFYKDLKGDETTIHIEIVACAESKAPRRFSQEQMIPIGTLEITLSGVDLEKYRAKTTDGSNHQII